MKPKSSNFLFGIGRLLPFLKKYKKHIRMIVITGIIASLIDALYPFFNRYAIDHFVGEATVDTLPLFIALYLLVLIFQVVMNYFTVNGCGQLELYLDEDLRNAGFNHLQRLSFSYFNRNDVGYIHARIISDTAKIGEMISWRIMDLVWSGSYVIFILIMMFTIHAGLALMMTILMPVGIYMIYRLQKKLILINREVREVNAKISGDFNEGITGSGSIKTLVIESKMQRKFEEDTLRMKTKSIHAIRYRAAFVSLISMMGSFALAVALWRGGKITIDGVMKIGTLSIFMNYALNMMEPIQIIVTTIAGAVELQVNIERFMNLLETKSDVTDCEAVLEKYGDTFHPKKENWEELHGDIEFEDVSFQYPDGEEPVLEHFNLKVAQGTNVAIVGETGAGKSTLVNLVCRFYEPTSGRILIDGRDIKERSELWLHSNIGYVLQTPHLFSGTVRDNLRYGKPDASDEEIWNALQLVSADFVKEKMEKGLDSEVGEGGDLLSTGEKQLLSFARALLADPKILVLDEATASIDTLTEKAIQDAIHTVIKGRTSFVIAHRLSTIVDADIILAVRSGKIVEQGTHRELMETGGYYHELYMRQFEELALNELH